MSKRRVRLDRHFNPAPSFKDRVSAGKNNRSLMSEYIVARKAGMTYTKMMELMAKAQENAYAETSAQEENSTVDEFSSELESK